MRIEDTAGNVYIKPGNCDCGLTGGCEKCKGIFIPKHPSIIVTAIKPSHYEEYVFYRKREIETHPEWGIRQI